MGGWDERSHSFNTHRDGTTRFSSSGEFPGYPTYRAPFFIECYRRLHTTQRFILKFGFPGLLSFIMRVELPASSFLSVALLILILPGHVDSSSIPSVTVFAWLFFCNLIHGVNSVLWSGNQAVHRPPWCDVCEFIYVHTTWINH